MQFFNLLAAVLATAITVAASPVRRNHTVHNSTAKRYAILDNGWSSTGFIPFLMGLDAGIEILALTSCMYSVLV